MLIDSIIVFSVPVLILIAGIILLVFSSDTAVEHSVNIATALGASPLIIGLVLVSVSTDLPEVVNSILASQMGHGDINVGDSLGSILAQITLVLGLLPFFVGTFKVKKNEVLVVGACEILSIIFVLGILEKGYITRLNALFLIASWALFMLIVRNFTNSRKLEKEQKTNRTISCTILLNNLPIYYVFPHIYHQKAKPLLQKHLLNIALNIGNLLTKLMTSPLLSTVMG
jgi:cation:H+ antiporter